MRLDAEGFKHVFIGGFACAVLGSTRPTEDIDILIETEGRSIIELRNRMVDLDERLARSGMKLYFVRKMPASPQSSQSTQDGAADDIVKNSRGNVLVETVAAGTLGLPIIAGPVYQDENYKLKILHPSVLPLTKLGRWTRMRGRTRPKSQLKFRTDEQDIMLLIHLLADLNLKLGIADYEGKTRAEILRLVSTFHDSFKEDEDFCAVLQKVMHADDWEEMLTTPPFEVESEIAPTD
ncbi:uncharacterized protein SCHCODRAFT_02607620 [Schizophyllum commune H4-8]|nr:uncharacterized protein SCHCODRAFT_02607620 [Schizophyllum commune H4-8]KAI5900322.1 hypothetical protein SCHCODRAFT_02607620 [Schizophyllum commune H4-8]